MSDDAATRPSRGADALGDGATEDQDVGAPEGGRVGIVTSIRLAANRVVEPVYVGLVALYAVVLVAAAALGHPGLAVAGLAFAVVVEWAAAYPQVEAARLLSKVGANSRITSLIRSLAVAVAFGVAGDATALRLYGLTAALLHAVWAVYGTLLQQVIGTSPAMGITKLGQELELRWFFSRARRRRALGPFVLLALELGVAAGLWLAMPASEHLMAAVVVTVAGVAGMLGFAGLAIWWARRFLTSGRVARYERELQAELETYAPDVIVYMTAAAGQSAYILNQWLPALDRMRKRGVIVVREAANVTPIGETALPIFYAPKTRDVERFVVPSVKLALYPANGGRNAHLARDADIRHIFLNHGDSDKSTSANPVARMYDEIWVAGEAGVERYEAAGVDIARDRFAIVGRPQVDGLTVGPRPAPDMPTLLYAPTFEGHYEEANYSSLELMGLQMVRMLLQARPDVRIIFKPHPSTGMERASMLGAQTAVADLLREAATPERPHLVVERTSPLTLIDCMAMADVLLSDISSVVTDFLQTERPILVSNPMGLPHDEYREIFPTQAASYIVDRDLNDFLTTVEDAFGPDSMQEQRRARKRFVLGEHPQGPLATFCDEIDRAYDDAVARLATIRNTFTWSHEQVAKRMERQQA